MSYNYLTRIQLMIHISKFFIKQSKPILISLFFFVTILTTIFVITDTQSTYLFNESKESNAIDSLYHLRFTIRYQFNYSSFPLEEIDLIKNDLKLILEEFNLNNMILTQVMDLKIQISIWYNINKTLEVNCNLYYYDSNQSDEIESLLIEGSTLPSDSNDTLLLLPKSLEDNFSLYNTYNISKYHYFSSLFPINVTGILSLKNSKDFVSSDKYYSYLEDIRKKTGAPILNTDKISILTPKKNLAQLIKNLSTTILESEYNPIEISRLNFEFKLNISSLTVEEAFELIKKLSEIENLVIQQYHSSSFDFAKLRSVINKYEYELFRLIMFLVFFSSPSIGISLLFMKYSSSVQEIKRNMIIKRLKNRGILFRQTTLFLFIEFFIVLIISFSSGLIASSLFSMFIINEIYNGSSNIIGNFSLLLPIFIVSFLCAFYLYAKILIKSWKQYNNSISSKEDLEDLQTSSLSIKIFLIGLVSYYFLQITEVARNNLLDYLQIEFFQIIYLFFSLISFLLTLIGMIFSIKQIFIWTFRKLSSSLWPNRGGKYLNLALKNIIRGQKAIFGVWLIIVLLVIFIVTSSTVIISTDKFLDNYSTYNTGGDYRIEYLKFDETSLKDYLSNNLTIVTSFTPVTVANFNYKIDIHYTGAQYTTSATSVKILAVDPFTFFDTIDSSKIELMDKETILKSKALMTNNSSSAAVSLSFLKEEKLNLGDHHHLNYISSIPSGNKPYSILPLMNLSIISSFTIFPLITDTSMNEMGIITTYEWLEDIENNSMVTDDFNLINYFLLNTERALSDEELQNMSDNFQVDITRSTDNLERLKEGRSWEPTKEVLRVNIWFSIFILVGCIISISYFQSVKKNREHVIERVLGLKKTELFQILLIQEGLMIFSALLIGLLLGILVSGVFFFGLMVTIMYGTNYLPKAIVYPFNDIFGWIIIAISVIIPFIALYINKQQSYDLGVLLKRIEG